jgi:hypothetical protein
MKLPTRIYHLAEAANWRSIRSSGLLSTKALLDAADVHGKERERIECGQRLEHIELPNGVQVRIEAVPRQHDVRGMVRIDQLEGVLLAGRGSAESATSRLRTAASSRSGNRHRGTLSSACSADRAIADQHRERPPPARETRAMQFRPAWGLGRVGLVERDTRAEFSFARPKPSAGRTDRR